MGGETELANTWALWLLVPLLIVVLVVAAVLRWRRTPSDATYVAHATRLRSLPRFRALVVRRIVVAAAASLAILIACAGAILLAARPQETQTRAQDERTRDIMLCLDVSGSMLEVDAEVVAEFREIVEGLEGERIGLTIWNGSAITVFPLTDDYEFVLDELDEAQKALETEDYEFTIGTSVNYNSLSQIGDGLVSCVQRFDRQDQDRGRAIVLASDNEPVGKGLYTIQEASAYALEHDVAVHGIAAPHTADRSWAAREFEDAVLATGGTYAALEDESSAGAVVESINTLEAAKIEKPPLVQTLDRPRTGRIVAGVGVGLLALVWLVQGVLALVGRRSA